MAPRGPHGEDERAEHRGGEHHPQGEEPPLLGQRLPGRQPCEQGVHRPRDDRLVDPHRPREVGEQPSPEVGAGDVGDERGGALPPERGPAAPPARQARGLPQDGRRQGQGEQDDDRGQRRQRTGRARTQPAPRRTAEPRARGRAGRRLTVGRVLAHRPSERVRGRSVRSSGTATVAPGWGCRCSWSPTGSARARRSSGAAPRSWARAPTSWAAAAGAAAGRRRG